MILHLIYGPTCSGKTDMAIQIAQETGWPVVALDRVQCCPQIATGSGRPLESELQSTRRIYLDSRPSPRASLTLRVPIVDSYSKWIGGSPKTVLFSRAGRFRFSIAWLKVRFGDRVFNGMSSGYVLGIRTPFSPEPSNALRKCLPSGKIAPRCWRSWRNSGTTLPLDRFWKISTDIAAQFVLRANTISQSASCQILMQGGT